jgi:hypothetical protein
VKGRECARTPRITAFQAERLSLDAIALPFTAAAKRADAEQDVSLTVHGHGYVHGHVQDRDLHPIEF